MDNNNNHNKKNIFLNVSDVYTFIKKKERRRKRE